MAMFISRVYMFGMYFEYMYLYSWLLQWYSPLLATNFPILDCHIHLKRISNVLMDLVPRRKMLCQLRYSNKVLLL